MSADNRTILTTCQTHGSKGYCNLRVTKIDGEIVLNPPGDGSIVLKLRVPLHSHRHKVAVHGLRGGELGRCRGRGLQLPEDEGVHGIVRLLRPLPALIQLAGQIFRLYCSTCGWRGVWELRPSPR